MKSVMISVHPKRIEKIASGKKTIEVRKSKPKLETPFKCYIYMTRGHAVYPVIINGCPYTCSNCGGMDVIGEFVCDRIDEYTYNNTFGYVMPCKDYKKMCLSATTIEDYGKGKTLYGWHISDLKIYDKSKELSDFVRTCREDEPCVLCENLGECGCGTWRMKNLTRPPQSWCYVEEI